MDHMAHQDREAADPHAERNISDAHASHDRHAGHSVAMFRDKFWLSFALTIPVVFWSTDVQHWLGYTAPSFPGSTWIAPILGTVIFVYGGLVFIRGAGSELADHRNPFLRGSRASRSLIYLDTHMLCEVYYGSGICVRNHCGAEPPRDPRQRTAPLAGKNLAGAYRPGASARVGAL